MRKILLLLSVIAISATSAVTAQAQQQRRSGTEAEQKACSRDVSKLCRNVMDQGDLVILSCLKQNRAKLSQACNQVLINHGQ